MKHPYYRCNISNIFPALPIIGLLRCIKMNHISVTIIWVLSNRKPNSCCLIQKSEKEREREREGCIILFSISKSGIPRYRHSQQVMDSLCVPVLACFQVRITSCSWSISTNSLDSGPHTSEYKRSGNVWESLVCPPKGSWHAIGSEMGMCLKQSLC